MNKYKKLSSLQANKFQESNPFLKSLKSKIHTSILISLFSFSCEDKNGPSFPPGNETCESAQQALYACNITQPSLADCEDELRSVKILCERDSSFDFSIANPTDMSTLDQGLDAGDQVIGDMGTSDQGLDGGDQEPTDMSTLDQGLDGGDQVPSDMGALDQGLDGGDQEPVDMELLDQGQLDQSLDNTPIPGNVSDDIDNLINILNNDCFDNFPVLRRRVQSFRNTVRQVLADEIPVLVQDCQEFNNPFWFLRRTYQDYFANGCLEYDLFKFLPKEMIPFEETGFRYIFAFNDSNDLVQIFRDNDGTSVQFLNRVTLLRESSFNLCE